MAEKQTSDKVSAIAARFLRMGRDEFFAGVADPLRQQDIFNDVLTLAASALSQDETKGER